MTTKKILAVDDEQEIRNLYQTFLTFKGYDVMTAKDANECIRILESLTPDLLLLDINMPGIDGIKLLEMIRTTKTHNQLPIIMISARGNEENIIKAGKLGCDSFIVKPFKLEELADRVALEFFAMDFAIVQDVLKSLQATRSNLLKQPGLKEYSPLSWDAYPAKYENVDLCVLIPRGVRPHSLSLLDESRARDKILIFCKHPHRWKHVWPREVRLV